MKYFLLISEAYLQLDLLRVGVLQEKEESKAVSAWMIAMESVEGGTETMVGEMETVQNVK